MLILNGSAKTKLEKLAFLYYGEIVKNSNGNAIARSLVRTDLKMPENAQANCYFYVIQELNLVKAELIKFIIVNKYMMVNLPYFENTDNI